MVQRLGLHAVAAEGPDSVTGLGVKIPQAMQCGQRKGEKKFGGYAFV